MDDVTALLRRWQKGDREALDSLIPEIYEDLRRLARSTLGGAGGATLNPTALVHEAFLRFQRRAGAPWKNRGHFFSVAAMAMRQIVIDYARRRQALRRGGDQQPIDLEESQNLVDEQTEMLIALDQALDRLSQLNERLTRVVECRFFAGLSLAETAEALGVTRKTVQRDWLKAQALLKRELAP